MFKLRAIIEYVNAWFDFITSANSYCRAYNDVPSNSWLVLMRKSKRRMDRARSIIFRR